MSSNRPVLSVVVPIYNEAETVDEVLRRLTTFEWDAVRLEIIVVESNSTDGSREIVEKYRTDRRVKIVHQAAARGKGNAVREGFRHVSGDIVLIQDGDLEYRIEDYPKLIAPILSGRTDFVLGCRHVRGQRMRDIPEQPVKGYVLNIAHWAFTALFDATYGVRLRDPFTMFKVFRREGIDGVEFMSDRFDFDWELLGKLIRRGLKPLEVPITYRARSFSQGKKVRMFADPPTWVAACFKFRFTPLEKAQPRRPLTSITTPTISDARLGATAPPMGDSPAAL